MGSWVLMSELTFAWFRKKEKDKEHNTGYMERQNTNTAQWQKGEGLGKVS